VPGVGLAAPQGVPQIGADVPGHDATQVKRPASGSMFVVTAHLLAVAT
jgi:hypothetical protein